MSQMLNLLKDLLNILRKKIKQIRTLTKLQINNLIIILFFLLFFQLNFLILKTNINFNLLKINSIAISSVIIVRGLFDYQYVRIIHDFAIFP